MQWKPISGWDEFYEVSNVGTIRSIRSGRILKTTLNSNGYPNVTLSINGQRQTVRNHRAVALAFLPSPRREQTQLNHRDADKTNNHIHNLEWCTPQENIHHAINMGLDPYIPPGGGKLTFQQVQEIRTHLQHGTPKRVLARRFGVAPSTIREIAQKKIWQRSEHRV